MKYSHLYDINFFVDNDRLAEDLTASDFRNAARPYRGV